MKIVFVTYHFWPPHFGGELKISIERFQTLVERGHSVTVLTSGVPGLPKQETRDGIKIIRSPMVADSRLARGVRRLVFPVWVASVMRNLEFDIVHHGGTGGVGVLSNFLGMSMVNNTAHRKGARTVIVHSLADTEEEMFSVRGLQRQIRNLYLKKTDAIVSVSPALHEGVKQVFPENSTEINNCIRDDLFFPIPQKERKKFREEHQIKEGEVVFSFLGSVCKRKGIDLVLKSFLVMQEQFPNWLLWVIGPKNKQENQNVDDEEIDKLLEQMEDNQSTIHFWGRIEDRKELAKILSSSDIFVFPTRKEGMPLAPLEALAAGTPIIISRIPGVTDLVNLDGKTGLYVEVNNLESLKAAMIQLGTNAKLRRLMGEAAHQRIKENFGWEKHIDEWESLYTSLKK
jgi:glycosyltransferase involved in cell wall biosynthesis